MEKFTKNSTSIAFNNKTESTTYSPAEEYFNRQMLGLQISSGIEDIGNIKIDLAVCLAVVYFLMYICIYKGVKSTGKAVYVTATIPYLILLFLLIHGNFYYFVNHKKN